jgi:antitoxin component HigA of HigAB toxin-antitoxin module
MAAELAQASESELEAALGEAFGNPEAPKPAAETPSEPEPEAEGAEAPEVEAEAEESEPVAEPEFEIEVDGVAEVISGADKIKEFLQRGVKAGRNHEENARVREALQAQFKEQQASAQFQTAMLGDIAELRALDQTLEQWNRVDWNAAFDADPFQALKLREQRDQLRDQRNAKYQEVQGKHAQFAQGQQETQTQRARAETAALLAKVPEWRNAEKAAPEKQAIIRDLGDHYGFTAEEIGSLVDHRMLLVARDAVKYRELQRGKAGKVGQVRAAPPVVKPGALPTKPNGKTEFTKVRGHLRKLGQQGNHRAQEDIVAEMFSRTFK